MEKGVKPGIVLISLTTASPLSVRKKSTRASPSQPTASKARAAVSMMSARASGPMRAGQTMATASWARYLVS